MSKKITYLLGAGASFGTIPIVGEFNKSFLDFARNFDSNFSSVEPNLCHRLNICANDVSAHSTVDTYARVLYISGQLDKLKELKYFLSLYFYLEQRSKRSAPRYDLFFAALLGGYQGAPKLPSNVRILSWNYDNQLELSAAKFFKCNHIHQVRSYLPVYPALETARMRPSFYAGFLIHKLNGSAELVFDQMKDRVEGTLNLKTGNHGPLHQDQEILDYLKGFNAEIRKSMLHYSWENDLAIDDYRTKALESIKGTQVLVVIGYSFPTFNRNVDKKTLEAIGDTLEKVYMQAPSSDVNESISRIEALLSVDTSIPVIPITSLNEFYIPFEFEGIY